MVVPRTDLGAGQLIHLLVMRIHQSGRRTFGHALSILSRVNLGPVPFDMATSKRGPHYSWMRCLIIFAMALPLLAQPAQARNSGAYSSALRETFPKAYALWTANLPARYRRVAWAADFKGAARPIRSVTLLGRSMLFFQSCRPHRCTRDEADAVVSPDGESILGVILKNGFPIRVGPSTDLQMACFRAFSENALQTKC